MQTYNQNFFQAQGGFVELDYFNKHFVKNKKKRSHRKHFGIFSCRYYQNYILKGRFNPKIDITRAFFSQIRAPFSIIKKGKRRLPLLSSPSCAPLSVTEYVSIPLNIPKYPWECLNKLSWLCQGSEYDWSSDMFNILLKMP